MTAAEDILNGNVRHQVYLQRYSTQVVNRIIAILNRLDTRIVTRLQRSDLTDLTQRRLDDLLEAIRTINVEAHRQVAKELRGELREFAQYEAGFQSRLVTGAVPVDVDFITPSAQQLYAAVNARPFQGRILREWFRDLEANSFRRLRDTIRMGFIEGRTTAEIVRDIRGTRANGFRDGIQGISRRGAETAVRTAINHTATVARNETYKENKDLIKGVKWVSTLDGRTSAICRSLDGQVFKVDKGPRPPAHPNCRSTTTPVLKSWRELGIDLQEAPEGTRVSLNGKVPGGETSQVPASETYQTWLSKQPAAFQDEVLGKTKGALFRRGDVTLDRFVDRSGDEYTLDELRRREAEAFERANL